MSTFIKAIVRTWHRHKRIRFQYIKTKSGSSSCCFRKRFFFRKCCFYRWHAQLKQNFRILYLFHVIYWTFSKITKTVSWHEDMRQQVSTETSSQFWSCAQIKKTSSCVFQSWIVLESIPHPQLIHRPVSAESNAALSTSYGTQRSEHVPLPPSEWPKNNSAHDPLTALLCTGAQHTSEKQSQLRAQRNGTPSRTRTFISVDQIWAVHLMDPASAEAVNLTINAEANR